MSKTEIRAAASIGLLYVVRMLGLFMVLPVLPLVGPDLAGSTPLMIGLALGIYGFSQACLQIPLGLLSDRIGRRLVIGGGLAIFLLGSVIAAMSDSITGIVIGRFLQGCGAIASTLLALVADVTRVEHRSKAMAIVGISIAASFGLAIILGPMIASAFGLPAVFWFCAASAVVGLVVLMTLVPTPSVHSRSPEVRLEPGAIAQLLGNPGLARTTLSIFMLHYLLISSFTVLPILMRATGEIDDSAHYIYYFWLLLASFVVMLPFVYIADRKGHAKPMIITMIGALMAASVSFAIVQGYWSVLASIVVFFMAFNLLEAVLPATASRLAPAALRGTAMGIFSTAQFAGGFIGGVIGGLLLGGWDLASLMYANAAVCLGWFVVMIGMPPPGRYRTVTCRIDTDGNGIPTELAGALLSVNGVVDVALVDEERLAWLKVDERWDATALEALAPRVVPVNEKDR